MSALQIPTFRSSAPRRHRLHIGRIVHPLIVIVVVLLLVGVPFWVMIATAGKSAAAARNPDLTPPAHWQLFQNLASTFQQGNMAAALGGSLLILLPSVFLVLLFGSMASWVLARRTSRRVSILYSIAISGIIVPPAVVTIVLLLRVVGLQGTVVGMVGVYMGMYLSTVIFFVTGFIRTIPIELEEAARVDGARPISVFFRIIVPLLGPVLATATILVSLFIWNDVFYALFVVGGQLDTLPLDLYQVASSGLYLQNWNLIFSYVILMSLPMVLIFVFAQRRIISGVTSGAVK